MSNSGSNDDHNDDDDDDDATSFAHHDVHLGNDRNHNESTKNPIARTEKPPSSQVQPLHNTIRVTRTGKNLDGRHSSAYINFPYYGTDQIKTIPTYLAQLVKTDKVNTTNTIKKAKVQDSAAQKELLKEIYKQHMIHIAPSGYNQKLWDHLNVETKKEISELEKDRTKHSHVLEYFYATSSSTFDYDAGLQVMGFLNAIMLAVAFTIAAAMTSDFWIQLRDNINHCGGDIDGWTYDNIYAHIVRNFTFMIYSSVCSLILSTFYYMFKSGLTAQLSEHTAFKQRMLIFIVFICTVCSVGAAISQTNTMIDYYIVLLGKNEDILCTHESKARLFYIPGLICCCLSAPLSIFLMW